MGLKEMAKVRIVGVPPGEAPLWVREKWVGLELPLTGISRLNKPVELRGLGVLTGPRTILGQLWSRLMGRSHYVKGYVVPVAAAVQVLDQTSPEAAKWWEANAPYALEPSRKFIFREEVCELVPDKP